MNLSSLDWQAVERLREIFLAGQPLRRAYWESSAVLAAYDVTLAERIGWKWDAVLGELRRLGWKPPVGPLLDFGCGSGVAHRRVLAEWGPARFPVLCLHDRTALAEEFSAARAREEFPGLTIERVAGADLANAVRGGTLVISHVLSELPEKERRRLVDLAAAAEAVIWVEPGTHADSRALSEIRELLRGEFEPVAPCTHRGACGMLVPGSERHWCHFFASPPWEIFADPAWSEFANRLGIDLRSLPYSYLVLQRPNDRFQPDAGASRVTGTYRVTKGYIKLFNCDAEGVNEVILQKRDAPALFKTFKDGEALTRQTWNRAGDKVLPAEPEASADS